MRLTSIKNLLVYMLIACAVFRTHPAGGTPPTAQGQAELTQEIAESLSAWLPAQLRELDIPGAAVAVVDGRSTVWEQTYGHIDGHGSRSVDGETLFLIRSISKSVTVLAVLMAVQDGVVQLDTPIGEYLPAFTVNSSFGGDPVGEMTLRHMLSSRAGFTHDPPLDDRLYGPGYFDRYIESISDTWLRFPVGYRFAYSNYGFDLAAHILAVRTGRPFAEYVKEKVLDQIGMTSSSFDVEYIEQQDNRALGHFQGGEVVPLRFPEIASAGLYSSIRDMGRYVQFHLNRGVVDGRRILRADLMEDAHSLQFPHQGQRTGYGLGLYRQVASNTYSIYVTGGGRGFSSLMILYPELDIGVALLTNLEYHFLTEEAAKNVIRGPIWERYGPNPISDPGIEDMFEIRPDAPRVQTVLGRYGGGDDGFVIGYEDGVLGLRTNPEYFTPLTFYDDDGELVAMVEDVNEIRFLPQYGNMRGSLMIVNRNFSNHNSHYRAYNDSPEDPPGPDRPEWSEYTGEYEVLWNDEPTGTVRVSVRNGYLYVDESKCLEHLPGLFFTNDGETLDFRSQVPMLRNSELRILTPGGRR